MRPHTIASLVSAAALAASASVPANAATRGFPVGGFDRVESSIPYTVHVRVGGAPAVTAEGPQRLLDRLDIHVEGGRLVIRTKRGSWWDWSGGGGEATVNVVAPRLNGAALSGPGDLDVDRVRASDFDLNLSGPGNIRIGQLEAARATLNLSGPGDIYASGRVGQARFSLSGPGNIHAQKLDIQNLDVALSGPGDIDATVLGTATGHLSGPGDIRIAGRARCQISKSGPGDVHCG